MLFDAYVVVDWSAAAVPRQGADSIWYASFARDRGELRQQALANPPTREAAGAELLALLQGLIADGRRVLVGFDFPNAYPAGFAAVAGFPGPPWRGIWDGLAGLLEDGPDNANNRFQLAAELNRRIAGGGFPFWGHPHQHAGRYPGLAPLKPAGYGLAGRLAERRLCERHVPRTKPCWQLAGNGSVGGQALTGIPAKRRLWRALAPAAAVWPFETGLAPAREPAVVLAEVYPSLADFAAERHPVKDARQVLAAARLLAARDASGQLAEDLTGPAELTAAERRLVEREEGWILGAGTFATHARRFTKPSSASGTRPR